MTPYRFAVGSIACARAGITNLIRTWKINFACGNSHTFGFVAAAHTNLTAQPLA
jgi:hypothetical protein